jgi:hypothetical protein
MAVSAANVLAKGASARTRRVRAKREVLRVWVMVVFRSG